MYMIRRISSFIFFKLLRWKYVGEFPDCPKSIVIFAPHTSYLDGFLGKLFFLSVGVPHRLLMAKKYFVGPVGWILKSLGFEPVDGVKGRNAILDAVNVLGKSESMHILICPEGHLRLVEDWNPGFLLMARRAGVPILMGYLDYRTKEAGVKGVIPPGTDTDEVWWTISETYSGVTAKYPEKFKLPKIVMKQTRVRFAPSPTGPLHIGGVRTALYNYLFAKKNKGKFILRIEDTDSERFVEQAENYIKDSLEWLGLIPDESPWTGGQYGPYRQSERKGIYKEYVDRLVAQGKAYIAFDTREELERARLKDINFKYSAATRLKMVNSLTLPADEVKSRIESGDQYTIRFKIPASKVVRVVDLIRGEIVFDTNILDDKVIWKSKDELPTYHLASVVDDHLMKISHVIRGEEWISSTPLHILLYEAFRWTAPQFAHVSDVLKPQGPGKLNKRDGDKFGFPVYPLEWKGNEEYCRGYREDGWIPQAVLNNIALIGWNPGTPQEIFSMDELIEVFNLERCSKAGGRFNLAKAKWFNHEYLMKKTSEEIANEIQLNLMGSGIEDTPERITAVVDLMKERVDLSKELVTLCQFFWCPPVQYDPESVKTHWKENTETILTDLRDYLGELDWDEGIKEKVLSWIYDRKYKIGDVMNSWRVALVGKAMGPDMFSIAEFIGKEKCLERLDRAIQKIKSLE